MMKVKPQISFTETYNHPLFAPCLKTKKCCTYEFA